MEFNIDLYENEFGIAPNSFIFISLKFPLQMMYLSEGGKFDKKTALSACKGLESMGGPRFLLNGCNKRFFTYLAMVKLFVSGQCVNKKTDLHIANQFLAAEEGFEPSQSESESLVLPLHYSAILVRGTRLELARYSPHAPQTCASADSATLAHYCAVSHRTKNIITELLPLVNNYF